MLSPFTPPILRADLPTYTPLLQLLRVTAATVAGPAGVAQVAGSSFLGPTLYVSFTQQLLEVSLLPRDREPCLVDDVNGTGLTPGFYLGRLAGSFTSLPVYEVTGGKGTAGAAGAAGAIGPSGSTSLQRSPMVKIYKSNTTWTKQAGLDFIIVDVVSGGGGGGGSTGGGATGSAGGGGGGGGWSRIHIDPLTLGATVAVIVGAGGAGALGNFAGADGGVSSFATNSPMPGSGGNGMAAVSVLTISGGGAGGIGGSDGLGTPSTGVDGAGTDGGHGIYFAGGPALAGAGGDCAPFGAGGDTVSQAASPLTNNNGAPGTKYGSGGGGAISTTLDRTGGNGTAGIVIVYEYYK